jgi:hypothetical protein
MDVVLQVTPRTRAIAGETVLGRFGFPAQEPL